MSKQLGVSVSIPANIIVNFKVNGREGNLPGTWPQEKNQPWIEQKYSVNGKQIAKERFQKDRN